MQKKIAVWTATNRCNLNCKFCFGKEDKKELNTTKAKRLINRLKNQGIKYFIFSGGEPLLRRDIFMLVEYAKKLGMKTILHTNGILVNKKNAKKLSAHFDAINLPIDGACEKTNALIGRGSLKHTLEVLDILAKKCEIRITTVATKINLSEIKKINELLKNKKIGKWRIFQFNPKLGKAKTNQKTFIISAQDFIKLKTKVLNKKAEFVLINGEFEKRYILISSDGTIAQ